MGWSDIEPFRFSGEFSIWVSNVRVFEKASVGAGSSCPLVLYLSARFDPPLLCQSSSIGHVSGTETLLSLAHRLFIARCEVAITIVIAKTLIAQLVVMFN